MQPYGSAYDLVIVWRPSDWSQIEAAIGVVSEGQSLDFKNPLALADGAEIAKDVAAMSVFGGVLAYGIDDQKTEVARAAPGVDLKGQKDRVQQIVNANVTPPLFIEVQAIEDPTRVGHGVLIVSVPPSSLAPHAIVVKKLIHFPVRSGTTTRYLGESELAELYARRASIASAQETAVPLLHGVTMPPWMTQAGLDMSGVGVMQITASAVARGLALSEYLLRERLGEAVATANTATVPRFISAPNSPGILDREGWKPLEALGWYSHVDELPDGYLQRDPTYSATYLYSFGFSYQITVPLDVNGKPYIWEHLWASNLVGALASPRRLHR
jgi:hypothetical protein